MGASGSSEGPTEWRVVRATCRVCGAANAVTCRPLPDQPPESTEDHPTPSPRVSPDPTAYHCSSCGNLGSAATSALSVAYPDDQNWACNGIREWGSGDTGMVMAGLGQSESYAGVERFLFCGWCMVSSEAEGDGLSESVERAMVVTEAGCVFFISKSATLGCMGAAGGITSQFHAIALKTLTLKSAAKGMASLKATFAPPPNFTVTLTSDLADHALRALRMAKKVTALSAAGDGLTVRSDRGALPFDLLVPPDGGFHAAYICYANKAKILEPELVLTDSTEEQSVTKLVLDGLLHSRLDISTWSGDTYLLVAGALQHNQTFLTLRVSGVPNKGKHLKSLAGALASNTTLTALEFDGCGLQPGEWVPLAEAISLNDSSAVASLDLSRNKLGVEDASALTAAFGFDQRASPYVGLRSLRLLGCGLNSTAVEQILTMLYEGHSEALEELGLSGNQLGSDNSELVGKLVGEARNLSQLLLAKVQFDPERFFSGIGDMAIVNKSTFFLREVDLSLNPSDDSSWLLYLAKIIELCGLNFERLELNNSLRDTDTTDQANAAHGLAALVSCRAMRDGLLSLNGNPAGPIVAALPDLMLRGKSPKAIAVADCALGDESIATIFNALRNPNCVTTQVDLSHNLMYGPDIHKFHQRQSELTYEQFIEDPLSAAAETSVAVQERNMVAFQVGELFESEHAKIEKFVLTGDPEDSLAFGIQLAIPFWSLHKNKTITHLDVSGNLIGDHGATALAEALKVNRTITALRTDNNRVTTEGFAALRKALFKNRKVVDWPPAQKDLDNFVQLLAEAKEAATHDEEAAHELVRKACSGGQQNLPLKERGIQQIRTTKEILRKVERDAVKVQQIATQIEDAIIDNGIFQEERRKQHALEKENCTLSKRRNAWWWHAREVREKRDGLRQESFEHALMYKMWSQRARLRRKWSERCKLQEEREESCAFFNSPDLGWAASNMYMTEWSHSALWKQVPYHQKPDWADLYEEGLAHFEEERKWKEQYPHLEIWLEEATPVEKPDDYDELAEVELYGGRGPEDPSHHGQGGHSRTAPVPMGIRRAADGWHHAVASKWQQYSDAADERTLLNKMKPIQYSKKMLAWRSQLAPHSKDITIVTQLSMDRLARLEDMTKTWSGVISAAVLLPPQRFYSQCTSAMAQLACLHQRVEARGQCRLDIAVLYQLESPARAYDSLYPINALRNLALDQARTPLVFLLDVDFQPSDDLCTELNEAYDTLEAAMHSRVALVVPAFECSCPARMPRNQPSLIQSLDQKSTELFHVGHFAKGHAPTDLPKWRTADEAYRIPYQQCFEPYVIAARSLVPRYDERFRGYGMNKIAHLLHMHTDGFDLWVLPRQFVCAPAHPKSPQWEATYAGAGAKLQQRRIAALYRRVRRELEEPAPTADRATQGLIARGEAIVEPTVADGGPKLEQGWACGWSLPLKVLFEQSERHFASHAC